MILEMRKILISKLGLKFENNVKILRIEFQYVFKIYSRNVKCNFLKSQITFVFYLKFLRMFEMHFSITYGCEYDTILLP